MTKLVVKRKGWFRLVDLPPEKRVTFSVKKDKPPIDPKGLIQFGPSENYRDVWLGSAGIRYSENGRIPREPRRDALIRIKKHIDEYDNPHVEYVLISKLDQRIIHRGDTVLLTQAKLTPYITKTKLRELAGVEKKIIKVLGLEIDEEKIPEYLRGWKLLTREEAHLRLIKCPDCGKQMICGWADIGFTDVYDEYFHYCPSCGKFEHRSEYSGLGCEDHAKCPFCGYLWA